MPIFANNRKYFISIGLTVTALTLFYFLSNLGYKIGGDFGYFLMYENFGPPQDLYQFLFGIVMYFTACLFGLLGLLAAYMTLHQLGRRLKWPVAAPTRWGFFLYLLTVLRQILLDNLAAR